MADVTRSIDEARAAIIDAVAASRARNLACATIEATDSVVRDFARRAGFTGSLRGPLTIDVDQARPPDVVARDELPGWLAATVSELSNREVTVLPRRGPMRSRWGAARHGLDAFLKLVVDVDRRRRPLEFIVPDRPDVMPEAIARALDMTLAIADRFPGYLDHVRRIVFDRGTVEMRSGQVIGQASLLGDVHINAALMVAGGMLALREVTQLDPQICPATVPAPYTTVDGTTAHEMWHEIDAGFAAAHFARSMEFHRELGVVLGVATLEHAVSGRHAGAADERRAAQARLVEQVSPYAGVAILEATAEMFTLWWCRGDAPISPVVQRFGELLDEFFPAPRPH